MSSPETAFLRSSIYELLAYAFAEPSQELIDFVSGGEYFEHLGRALRFLPYGEDAGMKDVSDASAASQAIDIGLLSSGYQRITSPKINYLYECNYHSRFSAFTEMADIAGFYRAFGIDFQGERPDHLTLELEFMRLLTMKEARALLDNEKGHADICISAQKEFLSSHTGRWANTLSGMIAKEPFYGFMSRILSGWIEAECRYLSVETDEILHYTFNNLFAEDFADLMCEGGKGQ